MSDGRKPDFVVRAKQSSDSEFWSTIGVGWSFKDGKPGLSVRLHSVPVMWTGEFLILPALEAQEEEAPKKGKK